MPLDFPNSPTVGAPYTGPSGVVWTYDGTKWASGASTTAFAPIGSPAFTGDPTAPTPAYGDNDTSVATTAFVQAAVAPAQNNVGRNLIHNPLFNVAQRGAGPWTTSATYTADRWIQYIGGASTLNTARNGLVDANRSQIGDEAAEWCLYCTFTGGAGAADAAVLQQNIENTRRLAGRTVIVSFWAAANTATPKLGVSIDENFGTGGSPSATVSGVGQTVTLTTTWTRYSLTFVLPSASGKTFGTNRDSKMPLTFWFNAGSNSNTASGGVGAQSNGIALWGLQLETGSVATPLEKPDPQQDLAKCQRFYQTVTCSLRTLATGAGNYGTGIQFPTMRAPPNIALVTAGSHVNSTGVGLSPSSVSASFFNFVSSAAGDAYALGDTYGLSADL